MPIRLFNNSHLSFIYFISGKLKSEYTHLFPLMDMMQGVQAWHSYPAAGI
jgi:hypothetical protein